MTERRLGNYLMLETLGQGGFSKVRLGLDEKTGERVALKILKKKEMGVTADVIKQVEREIHAMSKISHQNVIRLKEVNWDCTYEKKNGTKLQVILVVLELATGGELFDFLAFTGPFEEAIARTYFQQLIAGIAHCHSKGIAHRDLKPENLLLDSSFVLKLADFGFANTFNSVQNVMYTECGTPGYMAPEVFSKKGYDASAADIWSCGVVLFIQLAGFPPFQRPALNDWWFNKLYHNKHHLFWEAHQRTAYFSDLVKDFLNKILCPDVNKRMKLEELQKHPWFLGPTISHAALYAELQRRKATVDDNKGREKAEKAAEAAKLAGHVGGEAAIPGAQAGLLERGDVSMTRGEGPAMVIDYGSEALPQAVPSITAFAKGGALTAPTVGDQSGAGTGSETQAPAPSNKAAVMDASAFFGGGEEGGESYEAEGEDWGTPAAAAAPAPAAAAASASAASSSSPSDSTVAPPFAASAALVQSFTRFSTSKFESALDLYQALQSTLLSIGCVIESANKSKFKLKLVKCVTSQGVILFSVSVFADPTNPRTHIVEFKKRSQDSTQFRTLYAEIRYKMRDCIDEHASGALATPVQPVPQQQAAAQK